MPSTRAYATFLGAITDTIAAIHDGFRPFDPVDSFTIAACEDSPVAFRVTGAGWSFRVYHDGENWLTREA